MGLFNVIRDAINPEIKGTFDYLYRNYYKGLESYCKGISTVYGGRVISTRINITNPSYDEMKSIYEHKDEIISLDSTLKLIQKLKEEYKELEDLRIKYPHAFIVICNECLGGIIYDSKIRMPKRNTIISNPKKYYNNQYNSIPHIENANYYIGKRYNTNCNKDVYIPLYNFITTPDEFYEWSNKKDYKYQKEPTKVDDLTPYDMRKILSQKDRFKFVEDSILEQIRQEDIDAEFNSKIKNNKLRYKYYQIFLYSKQKDTSDKQYVITNINKLDEFIEHEINKEFRHIFINCPNATKYLLHRQYHVIIDSYGKICHPTGERNRLFDRLNICEEEYIIENKLEVEKLEPIVKKYNELKIKYPLGFRSFEDCNKNLGIEKIVEQEDKIAKFEKYYDIHNKYVKWEQEQRTFASNSRNLCPENFGCYFYDIDCPAIGADGSDITIKNRIWQFFYSSFYNNDFSESIDPDFTYLQERAKENKRFIFQKLRYRQSVYNQVVDLILAHKEKFGDISVIFVTSGIANTNDSFVSIHFHFDYVINKLESNNIPYWIEVGMGCGDVALTKHILILELITENHQLSSSINNARKKFASFSPLISYISVRKGYDAEELKELQEEAKKKKNAELEEKKRKEAELAAMAAEQKRIAEEQIRKDKELAEILNCVQSWHLTGHGIRHNYIYEYLKTTALREATTLEWNMRHLLWALKNDLSRPDNWFSYSEALDIIVPRYEHVLRETFLGLLPKLTFVCLPASTSQKNRRRWYEFAKRICSNSNMHNAYDYIRITRDAVPGHLGGDRFPELSLDSDFFNGRYVIICDDIMTSGKSLARLKFMLESKGANVICALTIGLTVHE